MAFDLDLKVNIGVVHNENHYCKVALHTTLNKCLMLVKLKRLLGKRRFITLQGRQVELKVYWNEL